MSIMVFINFLQRMDMDFAVVKTWVLRLLLPFVVVVISSCEVARVAPNAGDVSLSQDDDFLITDDEFAPRVVTIEPFEKCALIKGVVDENSKCESYEDVNKKTHFNKSGMRFLVEFNKPVYFDSSTQGQVGLVNAKFIRSGTERFRLQPVRIVEETNKDGDTTLVYEEIANPDIGTKHRFFTTQQYLGNIQPLRPEGSERDEGKFSIVISKNIVYDVNPNGKKIYNFASSKEFIYDNEPPQPSLVFSIDQMNGDKDGANRVMSSSADDLDGRTLNFSTFTVDVVWDETVNPFTTTIVDQLGTARTSFSLFELRCTGCVGGIPYASGRAFGSDKQNSPSSGVRYLGSNPPANTTFTFRFSEEDRSGDRLSKLDKATSIVFKLDPSRFKDLAGNVNTKTLSIPIDVDNDRPFIDSVRISTFGEKSVTGNRIIGIGGGIDFAVSYYREEVAIPNFDQYAMTFLVGNDRVFAKLIPAEQNLRGEFRPTWNFRYQVAEDDGSNAVGANAPRTNVLAVLGPQFDGDKNDRSGAIQTNWDSDISLTFSTSSNLAFDRVLWPVTVFKDKSFLGDINDVSASVFAPNSGDLNKLHIDGIRPSIVQNKIDSLSKILSGPDSAVGTLTSTVVRNSRLAVAIPFNEVVKSPWEASGIDFSNIASNNPLAGARVEVDYCKNAAALPKDCEVVASHSLAYSQFLSQQARSLQALGESQYTTMVFAQTISPNVSGVQSVLVKNITYAGNLPITELTDLAGNSFSDDVMLQNAARQGLQINQMLGIAVDGGNMAIVDINLMDSGSSGTVSVPDTTNAKHYFNINNRDLYIETVLNRDLLKSPTGNDVQLVLSLDDTSGNKVDVTSDSVKVKVDQNGNLNQNTLVFYYRLVGNTFSDYDGVQIKNFHVVDVSKVVDNSGVSLDPTIVPSVISPVLTGGTYVDTDQPQCATTYLTDDSNLNPVSSVIQFGTIKSYASTLHLALQCNQSIVYNNFKNDPSSTIKPFVPVSFGGLDFVMPYNGLFQSGTTVGFSYDVIPGLPDSGDLLIGVDSKKVINYHVVNNARVGELGNDHQFFTDRAQNPLNLSGVRLDDNAYFIKRSIIQAVAAQSNPSTDVVVDTKPYPIEIIWPSQSVDFVANYQQSTTTWLSGSAPTNSFPFIVRYGYYLNGSFIDASITLPNQTDVSAGVLDSSGAELFKVAPTLATNAELRFEGLAATGTNVDSDIDSVAANLAFGQANLIPYQSTNVTVVNAVGLPLNAPVVETTPIHSSLQSQPDGAPIPQNTFPDLKLTNTPALLQSVSLVADVNGQNNYQLVQAQDAPTVFFGRVYFLATFNKPMSEVSAQETYLNVTASGNSILPEDFVLQEKSKLPAPVQTVLAAQQDQDAILVYLFSFVKNRYVGTGIEINPAGGTDAIQSKLASGAMRLTDVYGNAYNPQVLAASSYPNVKLDPRSDIQSAVFANPPYKYGDVIEYSITTDSRINLSQIASGAKVLAQELRLKKDESSTNSSVQSVYARALFAATSSELASDANGSTTISFTYPLNGLSNQFNADTSSDFGLQANGPVQICDVDGASVKQCQLFATTNIDANGNDGLPAILVFSNASTNRAQVQSTLNRIVAEQPQDNNLQDSGVFGALSKLQNNSLIPLTPTDILRDGDSLILSIPITMLQEPFGTKTPTVNSNTLQGTTTSDLQFTLYNGIQQKRVSRIATFYGLLADTVQYVYQVQSGDLVHLKNSTSAVQNYTQPNGVVINAGADQALQVDTAAMFSGSSETLEGNITDTLNSNLVWKQPLDANNNALNLALESDQARMTIDTRPYLLSAKASTPQTVRDGAVVTILLRFDQGVEASNVDAILTDGTHDVTANLVARLSGSSPEELSFDFTVPISVASGSLYVKSFNTGSGYVRKNDSVNGLTQLLANLEVPNLIQVQDLTVDNSFPEITQAELVDGQGATLASANTYYYSVDNGNDHVRLKFTADRPLSFTGVNTSDSLIMRAQLDQYDTGLTSGYNFTLDTQSIAANSGNSFILDLDVNTIATAIEDTNGIGLLQPASLALTRGNIESAATGKPLSRSLSKVQTTIENFNVVIDRHKPVVKNIVFSETGQPNQSNMVVGTCKAGFLCVGASAKVRVTIQFSEEVEFLGSTNPNDYILSFVSSDGNTVFEAAPDAIPNGHVTDIDMHFTTPVASTNKTFNLTFDQSLIARDFVLSNGANIRDRSQNSFNNTNLSGLTGNRNIDTISMDVRTPVLDSVRFQAGVYANATDIPLYLKFNKKISITSPASITPVILGGGAQTSNVSFDFTQPNPVHSEEHVFTFRVDKNQDSNDYDGASYPAVSNLAIADTYGNTATITNLPVSANQTRTDSAVTVRPNNNASILDISVESNNTMVPKVTDQQDPQIFEQTDAVTFRVRYSEAVTINGATTSTQPYLDLDLTTSSTAVRATYSSGSGTDELKFIWTVQAGEEDLDGIELKNPNIVLPSGVTIVTANSNLTVPLHVSTPLRDQGFADAAGVLTKVRVDTLAPPAPAAVSFVVGATAEQNNTLTTKLRISAPSTRLSDIARYRVELFDGTNPATSTQYVIDQPTNVDVPSNIVSVYATADATGDIDLSIAKSMLQGGNCKPIYAKVYAVDALEQESTPVFSSDPAGDTQNAFAPFMRFPHAITLETKTPNGDVTTDLEFDAIDGYPTVTPQAVTAQSTCAAQLSYFFTIRDPNAQTDLITREPIGNYATWISNSANKARLKPFEQYVTIFIAEDEAGNSGNKSHIWAAYNRNLPIHYDIADANSVTHASTGVTEVRNLGNGATLTSSGGRQNLPGAWNLQPATNNSSDQGGYVSDTVTYNLTAKGVQFVPSSSKRSLLFVDHDTSIDPNYNSANKGVFFPDSGNGRSMTVYAVVTSPSGIGAAKGSVADEVSLKQIRNNRFQPFFFLGSGKYYDAYSLLPLRGFTQGFAAGFSARDGRMRNLGSLPARSDANYATFIEETETRSFVMPSLGSGARDILAYVFTPNTSTEYFLEVYRNGESMTTANNPVAHVQFEDPLTIDKLYFGGIPKTETHRSAAVEVVGESLHGGMLHEFMIYTEAHGTSAREKLTAHFATKWAIPLHNATNPLGISVSEAELAGQRQGSLTIDGTNLSCVNNTGTATAFPQITIQNTSQGFMHLLLTQQQSGKTAGPFTHMYLTNIPVSSGSATVTGTSGSGGAFNLSVDGVAVAPSQQVTPFTGLCNQVGENVYSFAAYISQTQLSAQQPNTTIAAFERTHGANIESRAYARSTVDVANPVLKANLEVAFSLRKVVDSYTGPAIRVSATDTKGINPTGSNPVGSLPRGTDILFDAQGNVDQDQIMQVLRSSGANELLVVTWYDQSGNGRDAYRWSDSFGLAPLIVRNGENRVNSNSYGKPAIRMQQHLSFVRSFIENKPYSIFGVFERNSHDKIISSAAESFLGSCAYVDIAGHLASERGMCLSLNFRTGNSLTLGHWDRGGDAVMVTNTEDVLATGVLMAWVNKAKHKTVRWWESQQVKDAHSTSGWAMEYLRPLDPNAGGPSYLYNRLTFTHNYSATATFQPDSQQDVSELLIYTYQLGSQKEEMSAADLQNVSDNMHQYWYID